jgi:hypothetical protein
MFLVEQDMPKEAGAHYRRVAVSRREREVLATLGELAAERAPLDYAVASGTITNLECAARMAELEQQASAVRRQLH